MGDAVNYHERWKIAHAAWGAVGEPISVSTLGVSGSVGTAADITSVTKMNINSTKAKK